MDWTFLWSFPLSFCCWWWCYPKFTSEEFNPRDVYNTLTWRGSICLEKNQYRQSPRFGWKADINFNGSLSDAIYVDNGVKQGDILAPTLFSIYFSTMSYAFRNCDVGVFLRFRTSSKVFNLRRFRQKYWLILQVSCYMLTMLILLHTQNITCK